MFMAFEHLLKQRDTELQLLRKLATAVQSEYGRISEPFHYLKLNRVNEDKSEIIWINSFASREDYKNQLYASKYEQAKMAVICRDDYFSIVLGGFAAFTFAKVFADRIDYFRMVWPVSKDLESKLAPPRDLIEEGFKGLTNEFRRVAKKGGSA